MRKTSYISVLDQFCGAGGSSLGAAAAGAEIRFAINHWDLAVETHNTNFPDTDHDVADISLCDPRRYPRTDVLITSPECTNHTVAKGVKRKQAQQGLFNDAPPDPSAERSRATMWDVVRFSEAHRHEIVIVENVVDAREWELYDAWIHAMSCLGYDHRPVYFNSMFAHPTPQSRDRMYVVFWRRGNRAPDLEFRPRAYCVPCGAEVEAVQSWKNPRRLYGKYGADPKRNQYVYRCPRCTAIVTPYYFCALNAIDWTLPAERIGDRKKPLKDKTLTRIRAGLERYGRERLFLVPLTHEVARLSSALAAMPTQTQSAHWGIVRSAIVDTAHDDERARAASDALPTQTGWQSHAFAFNVELRTNSTPSGMDESLATLCAGAQHLGVVFGSHPFVTEIVSNHTARSVGDALSSVVAEGNHHFLTIPPALVDGSFLMTMRDSAKSGYLTRGLDAPIGTQVATCAQDWLVTAGQVDPAFVLTMREQRGSGYASDGLDEPLTAQVACGIQHALVTRAPFLAAYNSTAVATSASDPMSTQDTRDRLAVVEPGPEPRVEDCYFRMLQPHEVQRAMAFPREYKVLGNRRDQVKQLGNAVTPPVMSMIFERCVESLR
jgi:DNA (cytosine-5)-methyltransferase 1